MLVAKDGQGQQVSLLNVCESQKINFRKQEYFCPVCKGKLLLKWGKVKIPHFAHASLSECQCFSEGESLEHLEGKMFFARWCEYHGLSYELEAYLPELQQRPDLLIENRIVLEFQCSPLSTQRMMERTSGYLQNGYEVFWILGSHFKLTQPITQQLQKFFGYESNAGFYYWQMVHHQMTLFYQIDGLGFLQKQLAVTKVSPLNLFDELKKILNNDEKNLDLASAINKERKKILQNLYYSQPVFVGLQALCYQRAQNLNYLPVELLLPVKYDFTIQQDALLWKYYFWEVAAELHYQTYSVKVFLKRFKQKISAVKLNNNIFPLVINHPHQWFFKDYLEKLQKLGSISLNNQQLKFLTIPQWYLRGTDYEKYLQAKVKSFKSFPKI